MSYHQDSLKRTRKIRLFSLCLVLGIIFYFSSNFIIGKSFDLISSVAIPIWRAQNQVEGGAKITSFVLTSKRVLIEKNISLTEELSSAKLELKTLDLLKRENEELMVQMGRETTRKASSTIATVLSGPNVPPYESLIIDIGKNSGVVVGDRVIYQPNILLGEIVSVANNSAKVKLYSASGVLTDVFVPSDNLVRAVAVGYGGGTFSIELPSSVSVEKGMQILIPGSDIYILGVVDYVNIDPITASQRLLVRYPVNVKNIRYVHVLNGTVHEYLE